MFFTFSVHMYVNILLLWWVSFLRLNWQSFIRIHSFKIYVIDSFVSINFFDTVILFLPVHTYKLEKSPVWVRFYSKQTQKFSLKSAWPEPDKKNFVNFEPNKKSIWIVLLYAYVCKYFFKVWRAFHAHSFFYAYVNDSCL